MHHRGSDVPAASADSCAPRTPPLSRASVALVCCTIAAASCGDASDRDPESVSAATRGGGDGGDGAHAGLPPPDPDATAAGAGGGTATASSSTAVTSGEGGSGGAGGAPSSSTSTGGGAVSLVCGDGIRGLTEECDDGPGALDDACTQECQVSDFVFSGGTDAALQLGRHTVAAGPQGLAVAFVDRITTPPTPLVALFGPTGQPQGTSVVLGAGIAPAASSSPVVAALPGGAYAAAWTTWLGDGDQRGVSLQRIDPTLAEQLPPLHANDQTDFNQYDADVLWTGSELVVAWIDDADPFGSGDVFVRTFDADLQPLIEAEAYASTEEAEARVVLAAFGTSWAAGWRVASGGLEYLTVRTGATEWEVGPILPGPASDQPSLVELDSSHLLLVFSHADAADPATPMLSGAVLAVAEPGLTGSFSLSPEDPTGHSQPSTARAGDSWFLAWRSGGEPGDPHADELWLRELTWDGANLTASPEILPLPRWPSDQADDQSSPALAATPLGPDGALWAAWESWGAVPGHPAIVAELIPVPILRGGAP